MNVADDETLMAFADGELDFAQHAQMAAALDADAALRQRAAVLRRQRERVHDAFAPVLDEAVPERLTRLLHMPAAEAVPRQPAAVVPLDAVRRQRTHDEPGLSWAQWGGMAASLVLGLLLGTHLGFRDADQGLALDSGQLPADGAIAKALGHALASEPAMGAGVAVQLSFADKAGHYCRTFSTATLAGLACREGGGWSLKSLAEREPAAAGEVRQAATALPRPVLDAVEQRMAGDALDAQAERSARAHDWRR